MRIEHIDDVLPYVAGRNDFVVARKDGYTVIDYLFHGDDTFAHPARRECRGIKFNASGAIIARPFGKFFNIGEREETAPENVDFSQPHWVMTKLDGSMIHPMIVNGDVVFATRMGRTEHAVRAERHLNPLLTDWIRHCQAEGWTPIMEWVAPDNRIIIKYETSRLVLLALRETVTGEYMLPHLAQASAFQGGLDAVDMHPSWSGDARSFMASTDAVRDLEGYVVRFANGLWVKCKSENYVRKAFAKNAISLEKNVLAAIVSKVIDDVKPLLLPEEVAAVEKYEREVRAGIADTAKRIASIVAAGASLDQRTFAVEHMAGHDQMTRGMAFSVRKGADPISVVNASLMKSVGRQSDVDATRHLFGGATWKL